MNKSAIKKFAIQARKQLMTDIEQKAYELGITKVEIKEPEVYEDGFRINQRLFESYEIDQRLQLIIKIKDKGFEQVVEEVAYTWFNRFIALRFMEINNYLPTQVRVLSSEQQGKREPDILTEALHVELDIDREIVYRLQDKNDREGLFKYLLIKQCNALHQILPQMFEEINDYTELLLPNNLLEEGSVIDLLITSIDEQDWLNEVEIIGWLYQYYISEKKDEVFTGLKKNIKITKENIPAATQLFTPKWIVQYMIENSVGRLWIEHNRDDHLSSHWRYFIETDDLELKQIHLKQGELKPEQITVLDPCMGSGHILVYAFDVLYQIYESAGYSPREIPKLIIENNLFGLDIDDRAAQLSYFAVMMKARSYSRRIFREKLHVNICSIQESNGFPEEVISYFANDNSKLREQTEALIRVFEHAKEFGSIIEVDEIDFELLEQRFNEIATNQPRDLFETQYVQIINEKLVGLIQQGKILQKKFDVVITNPPYMGNRGMSPNLSDYVKKYYPTTKNDLFAVMMERMQKMVRENRFVVNVTMQSWMFLTSFEKYRKALLQNFSITTLTHMGNMVMGIAFGTVATVFRSKIDDFKGTFQYVTMNDIKQEVPVTFPVKNQRYSVISSNRFAEIPGSPIAYWMQEETREVFKRNPKLEDMIDLTGSQHKTANNEKYVRYHWEIDREQLGDTWVTYAKGGEYRKWYGNNELVVDWSEGAKSFYKTNRTSNLLQEQYRFRKGITWTATTNANFSCRVLEPTGLFDMKGPALFSLDEKNYYYLLGLLNSKPTNYLLDMFSETSDYQNIDVKRLPYVIVAEEIHQMITHNVKHNIAISTFDWDSHEKSLNFARPGLLRLEQRQSLIETGYQEWEVFTNQQFITLKRNEQAINEVLIKQYSLENELTAEMEEQDITITRANRVKDVKEFVSYAVGCMFGRYSLDESGVVFAGGNLELGRYQTFKPDMENVIPITDEEYFDDDIVTRFVDFVKVSYGEKNLEDNLTFIADTLNKKVSETSRQAIRRYFLKEFYKDHLQAFKKRPIYWLFDSGKQNGFKALIYVHRYNKELVARIRTDYLHLLQGKYESELERLQMIIDSDVSTREKSNAKKRIDTIEKQIIECQKYDHSIAHLANKKVSLRLEDGIKDNYMMFQQGVGSKNKVLHDVKL